MERPHEDRQNNEATGRGIMGKATLGEDRRRGQMSKATRQGAIYVFYADHIKRSHIDSLTGYDTKRPRAGGHTAKQHRRGLMGESLEVGPLNSR